MSTETLRNTEVEKKNSLRSSVMSAVDSHKKIQSIGRKKILRRRNMVSVLYIRTYME
jgi:hypothetical protein